MWCKIFFIFVLIQFLHEIRGEIKLTQADFDIAKKECQEKNSLTAEEADEFCKSRHLTTKPAKCFVTCLLEHYHFMENGKYSKSGTEKHLMDLYTDEDLINAKKVIELCEKVAETPASDKCELGGNIDMCYKEKLDELGLGHDLV